MVRTYITGDTSGIESKKIDAGYLGKFLGMGDYALKNVIGLIAIILTLIIVGLMIFTKDTEDLIDILLIILPLFTLVIGYLAGTIKK